MKVVGVWEEGSKVDYLSILAKAGGEAVAAGRGEEKADSYHHATTSPGIHLEPAFSLIHTHAFKPRTP